MLIVVILSKNNMSKKAKTTPKEELPSETLLKDTNCTEWKIKNIIGSGGFGYVYCGWYSL